MNYDVEATAGSRTSTEVVFNASNPKLRVNVYDRNMILVKINDITCKN
jgi:hypothetical protein